MRDVSAADLNFATGPERRKEPPSGEVRSALLQHLSRLLPDPGERDAFLDHMSFPAPPSVRVNPLMPQAPRLRRACAAIGRGVPWSPDVFALDGSEDRLGTALEHLLGGLYIQAKAATLAVAVLDPQRGERVLDLAAAPGGKSTQIAAAMENGGLLVANEPNRRRLAALAGNLERCGAHNCVLTQAPGTVLARYFHNWFDRVLLDVPCSGDGILRKDEGVLRYWSPGDAVNKSGQQLGLARAAFHMLRPGGTLVYSSCSLSTEENEDVLLALLRTFPEQAEVAPVQQPDLGPPLPRDAASGYPDSFRGMARVWPHRQNTEGAFIARVRKLAATEWKVAEADAGGLREPPSPTAGRNLLEDLEERWGFSAPLPGDCTLTAAPRQLQVRPRAWEAFADLPFYVRSGMKAASIHKGHAYLTHQAATLWGNRMKRRLLPLEWADAGALFAGREIDLEGRTVEAGEVLLTHGPWSLGRGLVRRDGVLTGFLPRALRTEALTRLRDWGGVEGPGT